MTKINKTNEEWKKELSPEAYRVTREKGTEYPFTGKYYDNKETGMYECVACKAPLFASDTKFDSGSGWPSFSDPVNKEHVELKEDLSHDMIRTEVLCKNCGAHLGHVFPYGTGDYYCINSAALDFKKSNKSEQ